MFRLLEESLMKNLEQHIKLLNPHKKFEKKFWRGFYRCCMLKHYTQKFQNRNSLFGQKQLFKKLFYFIKTKKNRYATTSSNFI